MEASLRDIVSALRDDSTVAPGPDVTSTPVVMLPQSPRAAAAAAAAAAASGSLLMPPPLEVVLGQPPSPRSGRVAMAAASRRSLSPRAGLHGALSPRRRGSRSPRMLAPLSPRQQSPRQLSPRQPSPRQQSFADILAPPPHPVVSATSPRRQRVFSMGVAVNDDDADPWAVLPGGDVHQPHSFASVLQAAATAVAHAGSDGVVSASSARSSQQGATTSGTGVPLNRWSTGAQRAVVGATLSPMSGGAGHAGVPASAAAGGGAASHGGVPGAAASSAQSNKHWFL